VSNEIFDCGLRARLRRGGRSDGLRQPGSMWEWT